MADLSGNTNLQNRPLHLDYLEHKVPCPHISCRSEAGSVFFEETDLALHFRAKHARVVFDHVKDIREACIRKKICHVQVRKQFSECIVLLFASDSGPERSQPSV